MVININMAKNTPYLYGKGLPIYIFILSLHVRQHNYLYGVFGKGLPQMHTCVHIYIHIYKHTYINTHKFIHTHTYLAIQNFSTV